MPKKIHRRHFVITTGDDDGIGLEVTYKALAKVLPKSSAMYTVMKPTHTPKFLMGMERSLYKKHSRSLQFINSNKSPAIWVREAAEQCMLKNYSGLITGPLSKETIREAGFKAIGHTDILKNVSGASTVHMAFLGHHFNVLLATAHVPIKAVSKLLTTQNILSALAAANSLRQMMPRLQSKLPIALVGLNPHAGENGIIGNEELRYFKSAIQLARKQNIPVVGPIVPDAAYLKNQWPLYACYVAPYHDQGLIPFKLVHGQSSGAHLSVGLPFIRTSVDHGTAKNIYGKNCADYGSMIDAIMWANKLARGENSDV